MFSVDIEITQNVGLYFEQARALYNTHRDNNS